MMEYPQYCPICRQEMVRCDEDTEEEKEVWECPSNCDTEIAVDEMLGEHDDEQDEVEGKETPEE